MIHSRLGSETNLEVSETYDILVSQFSKGFPVGKISFKIGEDPKKIAGIQKVAQMFMKILFTTKGSDPINPTYGTLFSNHALNSNLRLNNSMLQSLLSREIESAEAQTKASLASGESNKATLLRGVDILGISRKEDSLSIGLSLYTEAGDYFRIALPFPQLDMEVYQAQ